MCSADVGYVDEARPVHAAVRRGLELDWRNSSGRCRDARMSRYHVKVSTVEEIRRGIRIKTAGGILSVSVSCTEENNTHRHRSR